MKFLLKNGLWGFFWVITLVAVILVWRGIESRKLAELKPWHKIVMKHEFRAKQASPFMTFEEYLDLETLVFEELEQRIYQQLPSQEHLPYNRYDVQSYSHPERFPQNWNRSFEMLPEDVAGGVLMLHGLTDSPYSMHVASQIFYDQGFYVLGLRTPGHGAVPAELTRTSWKDWLAAAGIGLKHVITQVGMDVPVYICGYSTGGMLALKFALDALETEEADLPDALVLFSPALAVNAFGLLADWHKPLAIFPFFEKFAWTAVNPEYEPSKYTSFAKHAGGQVYQLARIVQKQVERLERKGTLGNLPPVTAFQSVVDSTVINTALVTEFYDKLVPNQSELIIFDVNQHRHVKHFIKERYRTGILGIKQTKPLSYALTVITNEHENSLNIVAKTKPVQAEDFDPPVPLHLAWPEDVYSLSHVALLFPPDDTVYGIHQHQRKSGEL